jgi:DNA-directed RNA polymerase alpha subunit
MPVSTHEEILDPCPGCGRRFVPPESQCATFEHLFLRACSGLCPNFGTRVLVEVVDPDPWDALSDKSAIMDFSIENFEKALSVRTRVVLGILGVRTIGDLVRLSAQDITSTPKATQRTVDELIEVVLEPKGLALM